MISGEILIFNCFVENTLEYYRNVLFLIILKGTFFLSNLLVLLHANTVTSNIRYLHQYLPSRDSHILKSSSTFPSPSATNIQYPFHISLKPTSPTQFSRTIPPNVFYQSIHISIAFQNRPIDLPILSCHV